MTTLVTWASNPAHVRRSSKGAGRGFRSAKGAAIKISPPLRRSLGLDWALECELSKACDEKGCLQARAYCSNTLVAVVSDGDPRRAHMKACRAGPIKRHTKLRCCGSQVGATPTEAVRRHLDGIARIRGTDLKNLTEGQHQVRRVSNDFPPRRFDDTELAFTDNMRVTAGSVGTADDSASGGGGRLGFVLDATRNIYPPPRSTWSPRGPRFMEWEVGQ